MLRIRWAWFVAATTAFTLALAPSPATAQQVASVAPATTPSAPATVGPTFAAAQLGVHADATTPTELNPSAFKTSRRDGRILAIVGGAALLAGLLIGDDAGTIIAIGGAAVGIYGLYVWQR